jgi:hypothetical protein
VAGVAAAHTTWLLLWMQAARLFSCCCVHHNMPVGKREHRGTTSLAGTHHLPSGQQYPVETDLLVRVPSPFPRPTPFTHQEPLMRAATEASAPSDTSSNSLGSMMSAFQGLGTGGASGGGAAGGGTAGSAAAGSTGGAPAAAGESQPLPNPWAPPAQPAGGAGQIPGEGCGVLLRGAGVGQPPLVCLPACLQYGLGACQ